MSEDAFLILNGVNGATGGYLSPPLNPQVVADIALGRPVNPEHLKDLEAKNDASQATFAPGALVEADDLASAGWGVIFPHDFDPAVRDALRPLLDLRNRQAGRVKDYYYREYTHISGDRKRDQPSACLPGDSARKWLARNGALANLAADPENVPYYLMIVAGPEKISYRFQYELDVVYAVGRLWFEVDGKPDLDAFAHYARNVCEVEIGGLQRPKRVSLFGVKHYGDQATRLSADLLVKPLTQQLSKAFPDWTCTPVTDGAAKRAALTELLGGKETPALLFTASHGMGYPAGDLRQDRQQGALLCSDFQQPLTWQGGLQITDDNYVSAETVSADADLRGLITFHFACYGCGTPEVDDFACVPGLARFSCATPRPTVSRLPQRLLGLSRGALAVVGHVDRAWSYSFFGGNKLGSQTTTFSSTLAQLLNGRRLGFALEFFNQYHASLGTELGDVLKRVHDLSFTPDPVELADLWTADNDARNYVLIGDPAVRLSVAREGAEPSVPPPPVRIVLEVNRLVAHAGAGEGRSPSDAAAEPPQEERPRSFGTSNEVSAVDDSTAELLRAARDVARAAGAPVRLSLTIGPPNT
jgi:hypothetical protein